MVTSSTVTGFSAGQAHGEKAHGDAVIHMGGDRAAARHLGHAVHGQVVAAFVEGDAIGVQARARWPPAGRFP